MKSKHVIHFEESNKRHPRLEQIMFFLHANGYEQTYISIQPYGEIHEYLEKEAPFVKFVRSHSQPLNVITGVQKILESQKKDYSNIVFTLGHPSSFIASLASYFSDFSFVISHMQQPGYFKYMHPKWKGYIHQRIYKHYLRRANLIHSLSSEVREHLLNQRIDPEKIFSVYIGIDLQTIQCQLISEECSIIQNKDFYRILMVGRLAPEKNYALALQAISLLEMRIPNVKLLIAGEGPIKGKLENLIAELKLNTKVELLNKVKNVPALMRRTDLFLHVATTESYGQVYIEALISGLPIVCSRTGVAIDLANQFPQFFSFLFDPDPLLLSDIIFEVFQERDSYNINDSQLIENLFEHDAHFVYQRIIESFEQATNSTD
jgi:glycosyltransferase involved in cell wall biosynthesis